MALEKSVLTEETIAALLRDHYGLRVNASRRTELGSANCYRVSCEEGEYFLKEFQSRFSGEDLKREAALNNHLRAKGFPAAEFVCTLCGEASLAYRGHVLSLQEFIAGQTYGYEDFPPSLLLPMGRMLGRLHQALKDFPLPEDMGAQWLAAYSPEAQAARYDALLQLARQRPEDPHYEALCTDLAYKQQAAASMADYRSYFDGVTYTPTHGDCQGCQLVCAGEEIKAVIDFSAARTLPAVWEIMRSFVQTSNRSRRHAELDQEGLISYVQAYMEAAPLTKTDLAAMPYVYLFQLGRSAFGFEEYLTTDSEDREGLLNFAFWRTAMYREVAAKAEGLSRRLGGLAL